MLRAGFLPRRLHRGQRRLPSPALGPGRARGSARSTSPSRRPGHGASRARAAPLERREASSQEPSPLPGALRPAAVVGGGWRYRKDSRLPSPTPSPGERGGPAWEADRGAGGGGPWGGARRRRESILQPFRLVARGARGWRTGRCAAPGGSSPAVPEVRDKYPPPGSLRGRGVGICPDRAGTCVSGGVGGPGGELSRRSSPGSTAESSQAPERGDGEQRRAGGRRGQRARAAENPLRYPTRLASLPAPRDRLQKKRRP